MSTVRFEIIRTQPVDGGMDVTFAKYEAHFTGKRQAEEHARGLGNQICRVKCGLTTCPRPSAQEIKDDRIHQVHVVAKIPNAELKKAWCYTNFERRG